MNIISNKTANGRVFKCVNCTAIHIEYKNLNFNLTEKQFKLFVDYITGLNGEEWEYRNQYSHYHRKIIIPIGHKNFNVLLNKEELSELKQLINNNEPTQQFQEIKSSSFSFTFFSN